jgi:two-component system OmpR family response regulator
MQILLVEDDLQVASFVARGLRDMGHVVTHHEDGRDGLVAATADQFDVIILDRMLPRVDGLKLLQTIRATGDATPVLFLSALGDVDERVLGLQAGADDYLSKPFSFAELSARVEILGRRSASPKAPQTRIDVGSLTIDLLGQLVSRLGQRIELTRREFCILEYLARNAGRVVTRSMLLEHVWDYSFDPQTNIVDQHVSKLRSKIDLPGYPPLIHTVRGSGYVLRPDA